MKDDKSINLNTRDIKASATESRIIKTTLRHVPPNESKFAVLELSTKAVKLLIGKDVEAIRRNVDSIGPEPTDAKFDFGNFFRTSDKVDVGKWLNAQNVMNVGYFSTRVLGSILQKKALMIEHGVDTVYTIATAAYRTAANREEILDIIREHAKINVRILSKEEEAVATLFAYRFTSAYRLQLRKSHVVMIDQGGGSTEVSVFTDTKLVGNPYSINLGTTALYNYLFRDSRPGTPVEQALKNSDRKVKERLVSFYKNMDETMSTGGNVFCVAVGTAITQAVGKVGNAKQHDKILTREFISERIAKAEETILERVHTIGELDEAIRKNALNDAYDNALTARLGLPMFVEIMDKYKIPELHVSGTGLWYGIYFQRLYNYPALEDDED